MNGGGIGLLETELVVVYWRRKLNTAPLSSSNLDERGDSYALRQVD